jgi:hypothetical protein
MTKLIAIVVILLVLYGGWNFFLYWERVKNEKEDQQRAVAASAVNQYALEGMPSQLQPSLDAAQKQGPAAFRNWLKIYGPSLQDPRKAWIELDFCAVVVRDDPSEARRVFKEVKGRTPPSSPVWPRIKQLEPTYE